MQSRVIESSGRLSCAPEGAIDESALSTKRRSVSLDTSGLIKISAAKRAE